MQYEMFGNVQATIIVDTKKSLMVTKAGLQREFETHCRIPFSIITRTPFFRGRGSYTSAKIAVGLFKILLTELKVDWLVVLLYGISIFFGSFNAELNFKQFSLVWFLHLMVYQPL